MLFLCCTITGIAQPAQPVSERINEYLVAAQRAGLLNGAALVSKGDTILWQHGYGFKDLDKKAIADSSSLFQIGSLTKSFTSTLIFQLQEQGLLQLTDKLEKFFPFYTVGAKVTIEQLLAHTGGIYEYSRDSVFMASIYSGHFSQDAFWKLIGNKPLDFAPGSKYSYSNCGYVILGYVAEKVTGKSYWQLIREGIFEKAGMVHSGFDFIKTPKLYRATGYKCMHCQPPQIERIVDSTYTGGAGSIYTTSADLYRFSRALLSGKLISTTTLAKAFTPVLQNYAYGWATQEILGKQTVMHEGAIPGFLTLMALIPADQYCIVLLTNNRDRKTDLRRCYIDLFKILYNQPYVLPRIPVTLPQELLADYAGDFELVDNPSFKGYIRVDNGHFLLSWNKDKPGELFAEKKDFFFSDTYDMQLSFSRDSNGKVNGFTAYSAGKSFVYRRIAL